MSDIEVIKSYLVKLGFDVDSNQLRKFDSTLNESAAQVASLTSGLAKDMLKWQTAIVGAFTAVGAGVIGLVSGVAQADQQYRLFGQTMLMNKEAAQKLEVVTDTLGASMDQIQWDPELYRRAKDLYALQSELMQNWGLGKGSDFAKDMVKVRDLIEGFQKLRIEVQYFQMVLAKDLFEKLGGDKLIATLDKIDHWFVAHGPAIAKWIESSIVPAFKDWEHIGKDLLGLAEELGVVFTNFMGLLNGDTSIMGTTANFEHMGKALQYLISDAAKFADTITGAIRLLTHFGSAAELTIAGVHASLSGDSKEAARLLGEARQEYAQGLNELTAGTGAAAGLMGGTLVGEAVGTVAGGIAGIEGGPLGIVAGAAAGGALGAGAGGVVGGLGGAAAGELNHGNPEHGFTLPQGFNNDNTDQIARNLAIELGKKTGVPPDVIWSQWAHESDTFQSRAARELNNYGGIMYPGTQVLRGFDSPQAFADYYLKNILESKKYTDQGILQARTTDDYAEALKKGGYFGDSLQNYAADMKRLDAQYSNSGGNTSITNNPQVTVNITQPGASPEHIQQAVNQGVSDALKKQTQSNLANLGDPYTNAGPF